MTESNTYNLAVVGAYWIVMSTIVGLGNAYLMGWLGPGPYSMHPLDYVVLAVGVLMAVAPMIQWIRGDDRFVEWLLFKRETPKLREV